MNAISGVLPPVTVLASARCASAIRFPSCDSWLSSPVLLTVLVPARCPITLPSIGATSRLYVDTREPIAGFLPTLCVTIRLSATTEERMTSWVGRLMFSRMSVTSRPRLEPLVTRRLLSFGSLSMQLYAWWVCPLITASMRGLSPLLMSTMGPEMPGQPLYSVDPTGGNPPSCTRAMIDLTPRRCSRLATRFAVATSSVNLSPATPDLVTMFGVLCRVIPMKPTLTPPYLLTATPGKTVLPVFVRKTFAERYLKSAPGNLWAGQEFWLLRPAPSSRQPPFCIRTSSRQPSSNSWFPTLLIWR